MIRAKKILTLKPRVQVRKCGDVFHLMSLGEDCPEKDEIFSILLSLLDPDRRKNAEYLFENGRFDDIYYLTLDFLGESVADWDLYREGRVDFSSRTVLPHMLYLDGLRSPYNVGSIFRNAEAFGVECIFLRPGSASPTHDRARRTSRDTVDAIAWSFAELDEVRGNVPVFALELGGTDLADFKFPERGICILGSEETGVSREALAIADASLGRVSIRQIGAKGSINVASASAILLHAWFASSSGCSGKDA